jgi:urea transport system ATP-binding protein
MCGKVRPDTGRVIFGQKTLLTTMEEHDINALGIGRKFQTPAVFRNLTLFDNLLLALRHPRSVWATLAGALRPHQVDKIISTLQRLGLEPKAHHPAGALSHGEMQWLSRYGHGAGARLFLLDEPVAGMTRDEREKTGQLLQWIARDHAVLVVEHDMEFVRQTAHRVTVLHEGRVLCEGSVEHVQNDARVVEVYLGRG